MIYSSGIKEKDKLYYGSDGLKIDERQDLQKEVVAFRRLPDTVTNKITFRIPRKFAFGALHDTFLTRASNN